MVLPKSYWLPQSRAFAVSPKTRHTLQIMIVERWHYAVCTQRVGCPYYVESVIS